MEKKTGKADKRGECIGYGGYNLKQLDIYVGEGVNSVENAVEA